MMVTYTLHPTGILDDVDVLATGVSVIPRGWAFTSVEQASKHPFYVGYTTHIAGGSYHATSMARQVFDRPHWNWTANCGRDFATREDAVAWIEAESERVLADVAARASSRVDAV